MAMYSITKVVQHADVRRVHVEMDKLHSVIIFVAAAQIVVNVHQRIRVPSDLMMLMLYVVLAYNK
jgi:hypothetical protein